MIQIDLGGLIAFFNTPLGGNGSITLGIVAIVLVIMMIALREKQK